MTPFKCSIKGVMLFKDVLKFLFKLFCEVCHILKYLIKSDKTKIIII